MLCKFNLHMAYCLKVKLNQIRKWNILAKMCKQIFNLNKNTKYSEIAL